jgi:hypothetical protein
MFDKEIDEIAAKYNHPELLRTKRVCLGHFAINIVPFQNEFVDKPCKFLEIGVNSGQTTHWMLLHFMKHQKSEAWGIDPWDLFPGNFNRRTFAQTLISIEKLKKYWGKKLHYIKGFSEDVLRDWDLHDMDDDFFDIIYIDGAHDALHVMQDFVLAWPLLKVNGIMIFDDYILRSTDEVQKAVDLILLSLSAIPGKFGRHERAKLLFKNQSVGIRKIAK